MNKYLIVFFLFCSNVLFGQQIIKNLQWLNVDQEILNSYSHEKEGKNEENKLRNYIYIA
jgi:hypothetical protein